MTHKTKAELIAENERLEKKIERITTNEKYLTISNKTLRKGKEKANDLAFYIFTALLWVLILAVGLGLGLGTSNACPEAQECRTLDKLYTLDQKYYTGGYGIDPSGFQYDLCYDTQLAKLWHDIEALTDFEHDGNPVYITDVTVHYRYNTPQKTDYIEGIQDGEEFRVDDAKIYPDPPEWSYNSITIYPMGVDVSQPLDSSILYYFESFENSITIKGQVSDDVIWFN